jgi:hypothetical protein
MNTFQSVTTSIQGIEVFLKKNRALLAVEEVEHLENAIGFLRLIEESGNQKEKQLLIVKVIFHLIKFMTTPEMTHKISEVYHSIVHLL